jgi:hypothetical protein
MFFCEECVVGNWTHFRLSVYLLPYGNTTGDNAAFTHLCSAELHCTEQITEKVDNSPIDLLSE